MFDRFRAFTLRLLRVPAEPQPPYGNPASTRVFRAGRRFYHLKIVGWFFAQLGAVAGIAFSVFFLVHLQREVEAAQAARAERAAAVEAARAAGIEPAPESERPSRMSKEERRERRARGEKVGISEAARDLASVMPPWVMPLLKIAEVGAILLFLAQAVFSFALVRLDWEQRWYIVTDRSLRIRSGIVSLTESTMSFANLQQVEMSQGPLQRLLGLADVRVQSAGGGGSVNHKGHQMENSLKSGVFHGVENATEIRDLILDRLRRYRETGLGDPDDAHPVAAEVPPHAASDSALDAAREVLAEARALRAALG